MSAHRILRNAALAVAVAVSIIGCGGGGPAGDPSGSVSNALAAVSSGGLGKLTDFACAAHKNDIANAFGGSSSAALAAAGIKPEELFNAMSVKFSNVTTKEVSKTDTTATVHVTGDMGITFDKDKFKSLMKTVLAAQGMPTDDATMDTMLNAMTGQLSQTQHLDEDISVVKEGGNWLICE